MLVSQLDGALLDEMVAKALGADRVEAFSSDWSHGGPIIEREKIELIHYGTYGYQGPWEAQVGCNTHYIDQGVGEAMAGPTPLIAAMRAFVAAKFGEDVPVK